MKQLIVNYHPDVETRIRAEMKRKGLRTKKAFFFWLLEQAGIEFSIKDL